MNLPRLEAGLAALPLYQYAFLPTGELEFSERVRAICRDECPMYGKSWACPPAVGTVSDCIARCRAYPSCLVLCTVAEVGDAQNMAETLETRAPHEEITRRALALLRAETADTYVLSTEACAICPRCAWPDAPCRHPDRMFPCVESHGILVTNLAEKLGIEFLPGSNLVVWFSLLFYRE